MAKRDLMGFMAVFLLGCGGSDAPNAPGAGGANVATGGSTSAGGVATGGAAGAATDTGGVASTGGAPGNGGAGGSVSSGGTIATGGAAPTTGGVPGTGGAPSCPVSLQCGTACCNPLAVCYDDGAGNMSCAVACSRNSECPGATPVCTLFADGSSGCTPDLGGLQRCETAADCSTGACAPNVDTSGNPIGPFICVPNDGAAYHGCHGLLTTCSAPYCCFTDGNDNQFCATACVNDSQCGAAHCRSLSNANTTCSATMGCAP